MEFGATREAREPLHPWCRARPRPGEPRVADRAARRRRLRAQPH